MGQSQSRGDAQSGSRRFSRHVAHEPVATTHAAETTPSQQAQQAEPESEPLHSSHTETEQAPEVIPPSASADSKRSKRRSWLGLGSSPKISPSSTTPSLAKRRWRRSSRQASDLNGSPTVETPPVEEVNGSTIEAPASVKGKEKASVDGTSGASAGTGADEVSDAEIEPGTSVAVQQTPSVVVEEVPDLEPIPSPPPIDEIHVPNSSIHPPPEPEAPANSSDGGGDNAHQPAEQRHFPPAGTLVVVQGVVHTTDVPRRSIDSAQAPGTPPVSTPPTPSTPSISLPAAPATPTAPATAMGSRRSLSISRSSTPTPASRSDSTGRRNRLSALISGSRRSSMLGPRRESTDTASGISIAHPQVDDIRETAVPAISSVDTSGERPITRAEAPSSMELVDESVPEAVTQPAIPDVLSDIQTAPAATTVVEASSNAHRGRSTLSPGSIEVLGTLLSVAAAATAASLVTGSSDPLSNFRTGFGNGVIPGASPGTATPSSPFMLPNSPTYPSSPTGPERPLSPTPTAGLGLGALGSLSNLANESYNQGPIPGETERGRRSRVRSSWGGLRERLGLVQAPSTPSPVVESTPSSPRNSLSVPAPTPASAPTTPMPRTTITGTPADNAGTQASASLDPRERMLRDMARALSQGLGIADRTGSNSNSSGAATATPTPTSPPAGADAINWAGPTRAPVQDGPPPPEGSFERFLVDLQADLRTALSEDRDSEGSGEATPRESEERSRNSVDSLEDVLPPPQSESQPSSHRRSEDSGSMPSLNSVSDPSDEELEEVEEEEPDAFEDALDRLPEMSELPASSLPSPPNPPPLRQIEGHTTRRPGGGINWWRLYRFPPMPSPTSGANANGVARTSASVVEPSAPAFEEPSPNAQPASRSTTPLLPAADANVIVPVIVVGLQSVSADGTTQHAAGGTIDADNSNAPSRPETPAEGVEEGGMGEAPPNPRRQSWRNALSRFRPQRRSASTGNTTGRTAQGNGSRTFLIYVIGGYYPPNHHMVTGSDNLDSFEALLELAELLGQVKPPTATREEIEKSGLQVIKPCDLERCEKEGKVASNCVDRCLICLDDYFPEDDLRVMACKHAFHKQCVDKWLETGRNNCPACRSKGVTTSGDSHPSTPVTPAPPRVI